MSDTLRIDEQQNCYPYVEVQGNIIAELSSRNDWLNKELAVVTEQRDEALSELIAAREDYRQSLLARAFETEQRDRLAEALKMLMPQKPRHCDGYDRAVWDNAEEELAAVEGGSDE